MMYNSHLPMNPRIYAALRARYGGDNLRLVDEAYETHWFGFRLRACSWIRPDHTYALPPNDESWYMQIAGPGTYYRGAHIEAWKLDSGVLYYASNWHRVIAGLALVGCRFTWQDDWVVVAEVLK